MHEGGHIVRQRLTMAEAEQARELNRRLHVLVEAAQCLQTRSVMIEQMERSRHYAEVGPQREADPTAFERADRTRRVAAFLASSKLQDLIKRDPKLAELLLGEPSESVNGTDFMAPKLPSERAARREIDRVLRFAS
jgi:hypothetical protein